MYEIDTRNGFVTGVSSSDSSLILRGILARQFLPPKNTRVVLGSELLKSIEMSSSPDGIKIAVRVRPFNKREKAKNSPLIIEMEGKRTIIRNPESEQKKTFAFNYSYWSHDNSQTMATQETLFADLGGLYLDNAFEGFNSSLFAYGQTGSGKSYSMYQKGAPPGLIPQGCQRLFAMIEEKKKADPHYVAKVDVSYLELYMEKVKDLLDPRTDPKKNDTKGLAVRGPRPDGSFFVPDAKRVPVRSYDDIGNMLEAGLTRRVIEATAMNATSSRSHSIFTIYLNQESPSLGINNF